MHRRDSSSGTTVDAGVRRELQENLRPAQWRNPAPAERYGLVVVGAGAAGLCAAQAAAAAGVRVALVERDLLGGDCLNYGCEPSKALIRSASVYATMRAARHYGAVVPERIDVDFHAAMERVLQLRARLSRTTSPRMLHEAGIDLFFGHAMFRAPDRLELDGTPLRFDKALIATGAEPDLPDITGLGDVGYFTNETIFGIGALPARMLVIGGGPLGCELAQAFRRFGSSVIIVQDMPLFLPHEERDAAQILSVAFARDGIEVRLNTEVTALRRVGKEIHADLRSDDYVSQIATDAILVGTGRVPRIDDMGLDAAGVDHDPVRGIRVDDCLRTDNPAIYAAGDACMEHRYTHVAATTARMAVANALHGGCRKLSELVIPWCTYTDPEIAHVGLYVREAMARDIAVSTSTIPLHAVDRAVLDGDDVGFIKVHVADGSDRILGATIVSRSAGELIGQLTQAMTAGIGMRGLAEVIHPYPTQSSAIGAAARAWCREHPAAR
jgi:pyruvate/2-oxoglutarate dehydrogenase complex dihydrolipoamide dehydrogenase (E3) component